jgi:ketosteroid isomerase-like protein
VSSGSGVSTTATDAKAAFVEQFARGWAGGRDGFLDHFLPALVDEDVVLAQPLMPAARGHDGFRAMFEALFAALPDLRGDVRGWTATDDGVEIELALHGTLDGLPVRFVTRDRITLCDGRILARRAQLDPRPLLLAALRRPRTGLPLLLAPLRRQLAEAARAPLARLGATRGAR